MYSVGIITLGCSRNLLDSEIILGSLKRSGFKIVNVEDGADVCIVNTCAFVKDAREESMDVILDAVQLKKEGKVKHLVVCGCLSQLYKEKVAEGPLREVDLVLGTNDFPKISLFLKTLKKGDNRTAVSTRLNYLYDENSPRFLLTPRHYAYVKVSEGCSNFCSYCIISHLRGNFRSRSIESIIEEVNKLSKTGALKEINLIGQDTTSFGIDRYGKIVFPELLRKLCRLKNSVRWIRILYTHPAHYTDELIRAIRDEDKICKYLDLPIQHISDRILKRMDRHTTKIDIMALVEKLRKNIPNIVLRTSIIVGFPGESDRDFGELLEFLRQTRFDRLGAFLYSREKLTKASEFSGQIPEGVKKARYDELMKLQQQISSEINRSFLGREMDILIDEKVEGERDKFLGRTQGDAPEVDGGVYLTGNGLKIGEFCLAKIVDTLEYDLVGEAA